MYAAEYRQAESGLFVPYVRIGGELRRVAWTPQPGAQVAFLKCPETECINVGPRGTGKTISLLMDFGQQVGLGYGIDHRGIIFRHSQPQQSEVIALGTIIREIWPQCQFNAMKSVYQWPDGESLALSHFDEPRQFVDFIGKSFSFIGWEELTSWKNDLCFRPMFSTLRSVNPKIKLHVRSTTNPGGVGNAWVKRRYRLSGIPNFTVGPLIADARDDGGNLEPARRVIASTLAENKILLQTDPKYLDRIRASARSASERLAWEFGNWDVPEGSFLGDIWPEYQKHVVIPDFEPLPGMPIYRALDYGSAKPFAVGWFAWCNGEDIQLNDGTVKATVRGDLILCEELYGCIGPNHPNVGLRLHPNEVAKRIRDVEIKRGWRMVGGASRVKAGPADKNIFGPDEYGHDIGADLARGGVRFEKAWMDAGSRVQGAAQLRQRIESTKGPFREKPGLFVCQRCHWWLDLVPSLPIDPKNPDDVDTESIDHLFDMSKYMMTYNTSSGVWSGRVDEFFKRM